MLRSIRSTTYAFKILKVGILLLISLIYYIMIYTYYIIIFELFKVKGKALLYAYDSYCIHTINCFLNLTYNL